MSDLSRPPDDRETARAVGRRADVVDRARRRWRRRMTVRVVASVALVALCVAVPLSLVGRGTNRTPASNGTTTTAPVPPAGTTVTLAYVADGVGVVGITSESGASHLYLTTDFAHFTDVTPPEPGPGSYRFEDAFFQNPGQGWVVAQRGGYAQSYLWHTTDGGRTWQVVTHVTHSDGWPGGVYLQDFAGTLWLENVQPTAPDATLQRSTDGGRSWTTVAQAEPGNATALPVDGVATFTDLSHAVATASTGAGGPCVGADVGSYPSAAWVSSDGGTSWTTLTLPAPYQPTDTTQSCPGPPVGTTADQTMPVTSVGASSSRVGFLRSTDGGRSWAAVTAPVAGPGQPPTQRASTIPLGAVGLDGSWWATATSAQATTTTVSTDEGHTWSTVSASGLGGAPVQLLPLTPKDAWLVVRTGNAVTTSGLYVTADGGRTWNPVDVAPAPASSTTTTTAPTCGTPSAPVTGCVSALDFLDAGTGFAVVGTPFPSSGSPMELARTADGGATWKVVGPLPAGLVSGSNESEVEVGFTDAGDGVVWSDGGYGSGGEAFVTHDGGATWAPTQLAGPVQSAAVAPGAIWAVTQTCPPTPGGTTTSCPSVVTAEVSTDDGRIFTPRPLPASAGRYEKLQVVASDATTAAVTLFDDALGQSAGELDSTTDGGATWTSHPLPCPRPDRLGGQLSVTGAVLWLACAGQGSGGHSAVALYRSTDGGATWSGESAYDLGGTSGLPAGAPGGELHQLVALSATTAVANETNGGPVVRSTDGGVTWQYPNGQSAGSTGGLRHLDGSFSAMTFEGQDGWLAVDGAPAGEWLWRTTDGGVTWTAVA